MPHASRRTGWPRPQTSRVWARRSSRWTAAAWLGWATAFAYSLAPFDFGPPRFSTGLSQSVSDFLIHGLGFAALGCLDYLAFTPRGIERRQAPLTFARLILLCAAIEGGQLFVASRHATFVDILLNFVALVLGRRIGASLRAAVGPVHAADTPADPPGLSNPGFVVWALFWSAMVLLPWPLVTLHEWDSAYPLLIGNEMDGDRPWAGEIGYVGLYGRALTENEVRQLASVVPETDLDGTIRTSLGLLTSYSFTRAGQLEVDAEGPVKGNELRLRLPPTSRWTSDTIPWLSIGKDSAVRSVGSAGLLTLALASNAEFTVEAWGRPTSLSQEGPARIVSVSDGIATRNFTLAQEDASLVFRVRNRLNGANGMRFELRSEELLSGDRVHMAATYLRGASTVFLNGARASRTVDLREPSALLGLGTRPAGAAAVAVLAALTLILVWPPSVRRASTEVLWLVATGYGALLIPAALVLPTSFSPAAGLYVWFGPAVLGSYLAVRHSAAVG